MNRSLRVTVDAGSWDSIPVELANRDGQHQVDVRYALIFTALWTRPPQVSGLSLSDAWAWHRYSAAFANTSDLRLREEWNLIDPHQKTVLSDELGVGFTTQLVQEAFGCSEFADALYVVRILEPNAFMFVSNARRGPQKSPDYVARLGNSSWLVLECKGTQSSVAALRAALARGREQKRGLRTKNTASSIKHSLVAGLFIPQWEKSEGACIRVADPSWEDLDSVLSRQPPHRVRHAITQVALAKQLALSGFAALPNYLASAPVREPSEPPRDVRIEVEKLLSEDYRVVFDSADCHGRRSFIKGASRVSLSVRASKDLLDRLNGPGSIGDAISSLSVVAPGAWRIEPTESSFVVSTPMGMSFRLEVEPHAEAVESAEGP